MKDLFGRLLLFAEEQFSHLRVRSAERRLKETEIGLAVERVVDQVNPRLRGLGGYRKRLAPVVEECLNRARELAGQVPGPVRVDRRAWATDPCVNALFGGVERMRRVLTGPEVRRYVKEHPSGEDCFAVLASLPMVKDQLGMELAGESVQRDVRHTTISFSDHEVGLVGATEEEVRRALVGAALDVLVGIAVEDIVARESRITELEDRLRIVRLKRKVVDAGSRGAAFILDGSTAHLAELETLESRIAALETELKEAKRGMESLDDYLTRLVTLLEDPRAHLGLENVKVRLDRMNIVREDGDEATSNEVSFVRARRREDAGRVISLIRFPRSELLEDAERLKELGQYLS